MIERFINTEGLSDVGIKSRVAEIKMKGIAFFFIMGALYLLIENEDAIHSSLDNFFGKPLLKYRHHEIMMSLEKITSILDKKY